MAFDDTPDTIRLGSILTVSVGPRILDNIQTVVCIDPADLKIVLQRALNTWPDAPKYLFELSDKLHSDENQN